MEYLITDRYSVLGTLTLVSLFTLLFYAFKYKRYVDKLMKLPNSRIHPFFGDTPAPHIKPLTMMVQIYDGLCHLFLKEGVVLVWILFQPLVILFSAESVEALMNNPRLLTKSDDYYFLRAWLGEGLLLSRDKKWKTRRRMLTPSFHFKNLTRFQPIIDECCARHVTYWRKLLTSNNNGSFLDIKTLVNNLTLDIITESVMGVTLDNQNSESERFKEALKDVAECFLVRVQRPWLWPDFLHNLSAVGKKFNHACCVLNGIGRKIISEKSALYGSKSLEDSSMDSSFLDILLRCQRLDPTITENDILEEVNTFLFAGPDTTSSNLTWALYMIGLHQEVQNKVYTEIEEEIGTDTHRPLTQDDLKRFKYLESVIKETQRLFPPATITGRRLTEDLNLSGGRVVPAGTTTWIFYRALHRDPKYFPNPEKFDPDRFTMENSVGRHPMAFIPFAAGPRNCIGQRLASMIVKTTLLHLVRSFHFNSTQTLDKVSLSNEIVLKPTHTLPITTKLR